MSGIRRPVVLLSLASWETVAAVKADLILVQLPWLQSVVGSIGGIISLDQRSFRRRD